MAYESPINLVMGTPQTTVEEIRDGITGLIEKEIVNTLVKLRVNVDKDELIKTLEYDRHQYEKGYKDAKAEIVRCKDCKHHRTHRCMDSMPIERCDLDQTFYDAEVDYCSLAERREVTT